MSSTDVLGGFHVDGDVGWPIRLEPLRSNAPGRSIMRCTSIGSAVHFLTAATIAGPKEMLSTKMAVHDVEVNQSAPAPSMRVRPRRGCWVKSLARIEAATMIGSVSTRPFRQADRGSGSFATSSHLARMASELSHRRTSSASLPANAHVEALHGALHSRAPGTRRCSVHPRRGR